MPTGYTANIPDGITFEQFAMQCARAMGALIMMRDLSSDAEIPEKFEPSDYHAKKLKEANDELARLRALSSEEIARECSKEHESGEERKASRSLDNRNRIEAYKAMLGKVNAWQVPTKDHEGLKKFMTEQLTGSIDFDDDSKFLQPSDMPCAEDWFKEKCRKTERDMNYHARSHREEVARTNARNEWLSQLRASLRSDSDA